MRSQTFLRPETGSCTMTQHESAELCWLTSWAEISRVEDEEGESRAMGGEEGTRIR